MSLFPALDAFRQACFGSPAPSGSEAGLPAWARLWASVRRHAFTQPRSQAVSVRHDATQAGLVLSEDGTATLRAGHVAYDHRVGAALVLRSDGRTLLTAPGGLVTAGPVSALGPLCLPGKASESLSFSAGTMRLAEAWETRPVVVLTNPLALQEFVIFTAAAPTVPVPLSRALSTALLYEPVPTPVPLP